MNVTEERKRDNYLHKAEIRALKNKINAKKDETKKEYGIIANAIHKNRTMFLMNINVETQTGICSCGNAVDICDNAVYCRYCGQRTSGIYGWTVDDYYNEKQSYRFNYSNKNNYREDEINVYKIQK